MSSHGKTVPPETSELGLDREQWLTDEQATQARASQPGGVPAKLIDGYRLLERLGQGAMGEVWLVEHEELGTRYAMKLISEDQLEDEVGLARFQREVELLAMVDRHPGIVRIHSSGVAPGGRPYFVMEYVRGRTLRAALREGDLGREELLDLLEQVCEGLAFVHQRGLVHRDVKPDNIILPEEGGARLTDFGLARGQGNERLTLTQDIVGTPAYMSPEQLCSKDREAIGPWTDVWALGAILHHILVGEVPYKGPVTEIYTALIERAPIMAPSRVSPDVPPALDGPCLRALEHDPARRPCDARAFLRELRAARAGDAPPIVPALEDEPTSYRGLLLIAAAAVLLAAGALASRALRREDPSPAPSPPRIEPAPVAPPASASGQPVPDPAAAFAAARAAGQELARRSAGDATVTPEAWEAQARALRACRTGGPGDVTVRLWAAAAWAEAHRRRLSAGERPDEGGVVEVRRAALEELEPLLARVPVGPLARSRRELFRAVQTGDPAAIESAEAALAARAVERSRHPAIGSTLSALLLAAGLRTDEAVDAAGAYLALAGDLPARAVLALERGAGASDPRERLAALDDARRLAPWLPAVRLAHEGQRREVSERTLDAESLRSLVGLLADGPELGGAVWETVRAIRFELPIRDALLSELRAGDRDSHLARALVWLRIANPGAEEAGRAEAELRLALGLEPGCWIAHLLLAEASSLAGRPDEARVALRRAEALAPGAAIATALRLGMTDPGRWGNTDLEDLALRGYVRRAGWLLGVARGEAVEPPLPLGFRDLLARRAKGPDGERSIDLTREGDRAGLLGFKLELEKRFPRLYLTLAVERAGDLGGALPPRDVLTVATKYLPSDDPLRRVATALVLGEEDAARLALAAIEPPGSPPMAPRLSPFAPAGEGPALPDVPAIAQAWEGLHRPEALLFRLAQASPEPLELTGSALSLPHGKAAALIRCVAERDVQRAGVRWLLEAGLLDEAREAAIRAAVLDRDEGGTEASLLERIEDAVEWFTDQELGPAEELAGALAAEATRRWGHRPATRASVAGARADLLLWGPGRRPDPPRALLEQARDAALVADPALTEECEPAWWAHARRARVHGLLGDREACAGSARLAREEVRRRREQGRSVSGWRVRALERDPHRARLEEAPAWKELLAEVAGQ